MSMEANKTYLISFLSHRLGYGKVELSNPHQLGIPEGVTVILGNNGSGKTTLATILEKGRYAYGNRLGFKKDSLKIKMLSFSDIHSLSGMEVRYMAQRMESSMNDYVPDVASLLGNKINHPLWKQLSSTLSLNDVVDKKINFLSSGELRKLLIINALLEDPDVIILDNPYIGLDAPSREEFNKAMESLRKGGKSIVLAMSDPSDIPSFTDAVLFLNNRKIENLIADKDKISFLREVRITDKSKFKLPERPKSSMKDYEIAFSIHKGHVRYGDREIFKNVDWSVKKGERWVLTGANGSGKSLLLSMVCADNPQGYANDILLFDRKRGSGESIWEIKDAIGYVSPEMQLFFRSNSNVREIVIQGGRNSLNRYRKPSEEEIKTADHWLELLGISHLAERDFTALSTGEQRLVLVARALIKQPELLVLDEPLHGLDPERKEKIKAIIDALMKKNDTSLIYVTHYLTEIPSCVDNVFELSKCNGR